MSCTHIQTTYLGYTPLPPLLDLNHSILSPRLCALHLCQPHPTSHSAPCCPSPGLLSCRMMARKKSWENMVLTPCPSCLHPPSSHPLPAQPTGLTAWCWAAEKSSSGPPSHQGRASARQDPPPPGVLKGGAKTTILGNLLGMEMG